MSTEQERASWPTWKRQLRMNIRNFMLVHTIPQLEQEKRVFRDRNSSQVEFECACVDELIAEAKDEIVLQHYKNPASPVTLMGAREGLDITMCMCDICVEAREEWAAKQSSVTSALDPRDAEDG